MKKGQILLITVMLLATVMTVLLSITFQSTTETQVTKLEEESQKALSAAEAAIEASLKSGGDVSFASSSQLSSLAASFTGGATVGSTVSNTFTSPVVTKDSAYTFYLGDYADGVIGASTNQDVTVCFNSDSAIEITLLKSDGIIKKYVVDSTGEIENSLPSSGSCDGSFAYSYTVPGSIIGNNGQILFVRVLFASTRLLFSADGDLPPQGNTITSQAKSTAGVSKKVVLFQSYPQLPAEFFATTF